jgi:hypothetical protein
MEHAGPPLGCQPGPARRGIHDLVADREVPQHTALVVQLERGAEAPRPDVPDVMHQGGGDQQVGVEARVPLTQRLGERRHPDRLLQESAPLRVMSGSSARGAVRQPSPSARSFSTPRVNARSVKSAISGEVLCEASQLLRLTMASGEDLLRVCLLPSGGEP